jgi:predicted nucleic acid-binding protein
LIHVDAEIGRAAGRMSDAATAKGVNPGLADGLIAATARTRDLLLLTRNGRHFDALGVAHADPFVALPD